MFSFPLKWLVGHLWLQHLILEAWKSYNICFNTYPRGTLSKYFYHIQLYWDFLFEMIMAGTSNINININIFLSLWSNAWTINMGGCLVILDRLYSVHFFQNRIFCWPMKGFVLKLFLFVKSLPLVFLHWYPLISFWLQHLALLFVLNFLRISFP